MDSTELPNTSQSPKGHPDCCLSISTSLLSKIADAISVQKPHILSIGCGTGLLEALLSQKYPVFRIEGIEVHSASKLNRYLDAIHHVSGTWDAYQEWTKADVLMFVYPREPKLVRKYVDGLELSRTKVVIWLGPVMDWSDYQGLFEEARARKAGAALNLLRGTEAGLVEYEIMAILSLSSS